MKKNFVSEKYVSNRTMPINLDPDHDILFRNEYQKNIEKSYYFNLNNILIANNHLFKFRFFSLEPQYFKMDTENWNSTLISIKQIRDTFLKGNKPESIEKGSWVIDDKSFNFFHFMTDVLSRISMIENELEEYPILLPNSFKTKNYILEILNLLQIPTVFYDENKKYYIKELLITSHAAPAGNYNKYFINRVKNQLITEQILDHKKSYPKKIWLSRKNQLRRQLINEEEILEILEKYDYETIYPEELSIKSQINFFHNAKTVAGPHGAAFTNIMFMKPKSNIVEIRNQSDSVRNAFYSLSSEFNLNYYYLLADAPSPNLVSDLKMDGKSFETLIQKLENNT